MRQFFVAICLCVAFSALVNAAPRKIAYDRTGKIFVADVDGQRHGHAREHDGVLERNEQQVAQS